MTDDKKQKIRAALVEWQRYMHAAETARDDVFKLFGCEPESKLNLAISEIQAAYTRAVADLTGAGHDILESWWREDDLGNRAMRIGFIGEPLRTISTIEELAQFVVEDLERAEAMIEGRCVN